MVLRAEELGVGEVRVVDHGGDRVAICRTAEGVFAIEDTCPHAGASLGEGELDGVTLRCPWHGWTFDVRTGACPMGSFFTARTWVVEEVDGELVLRG